MLSKSGTVHNEDINRTPRINSDISGGVSVTQINACIWKQVMCLCRPYEGNSRGTHKDSVLGTTAWANHVGRLIFSVVFMCSLTELAIRRNKH